MIPAILFTLFFGISSSIAGVREGEPGPARRSCDENQVRVCEENNRHDERMCRERAATHAAQEQVVNGQLEDLARQAGALESAMRSGETGIALLRSELRFLDDKSKKSSSAAAIFPGSPPLEKIFSLDRFSTDWDIRYTEQLKQKLLSRESELVNSSQKFSAERAKIESEISSLQSARASILEQKNIWLNNANTHASRWQNECRQRICPYN